MDKITQADREAAASLWVNVDGDVPTPAILAEAERYRQGVYDHTPAVQAFARHRLATRTDATPVATDVAALVEAAKASAEGWANVVEFNLMPMQHWQTANDLQRQLRQALAPFTKGQP